MTNVTAVLVARNGAQYLPATIAALAAQSRRPDRVIAIDAGSHDRSMAILRESLPDALIVAGRRSTLAQAANAALAGDAGHGEHDWYWFLGADNAPHPRALESLLGAVEISPSVVVAGPKLMRWDQAGVIVGYGETITRFGSSLQLVSGELDQSQHDRETDVLGVAVPGMLVQAAVWHRLRGFDHGLPSVDAGLDFGIRARLAGHRVERVPEARVAAAGPVELFGRKGISSGARNAIHRAAHIHRRLTYAKAPLVPLLWLAILPVAIVRALWQVLAKRPGLAPGEIGAGLRGMFDPTVVGARAAIAANRELDWSAIAPLRATPREARELRERARAFEARTADVPLDERERPSFFTGGGGWAALFAAVAAFVLFGRLVGASALAGGALVPLGPIESLWDALGIVWRPVQGGLVAPADPFSALLALLGSLTWWEPSYAIVLLTIAAMPLAAITAWFCAARLAHSSWAPSVAAVGWAAAPPLLLALGEGQLGAVLAHVLLPTLVLATLEARRSWAMAGLAGLLFAAVTASAPVLAPALVVLLVLLAIVQPTRLHRLLVILVPAAALFAPLVVEQLRRGAPLAVLADPGVPVVRDVPRLVALVLGSPTADYAGWRGFPESLGLPVLAGVPGPLVLAIVVAPLAVVALLALFLKGGARAIPALVIALAGLVTAVGAAHIAVALADGEPAAIWAGSGLSLYWLGLLGAAGVALDLLGRFATAPALVVLAGLVLAAVPAGLAGVTGTTAVQASPPRVLPALVAAEGSQKPGIGTLVLTARGADEYAVSLERGRGATLERWVTAATTRTEIGREQERVARLAGNLVSSTGLDIAAEADALGVSFVLLRGEGLDSPAHARAVDAITAGSAFVSVGQTPMGLLWQRAEPTAPPPLPGSSTWDSAAGTIAAGAQIAVFAFALLLAVPTSRRRRVRAARGGLAPPPQPDGDEE